MDRASASGAECIGSIPIGRSQTNITLVKKKGKIFYER